MRVGRHQVSSGALEAEQRRQALFHDTNPELSAYVPERPWNSVIRESSQDRDFWKEELEDKVADYRNVSRLVHKASAPSSHAGDGRNRSRSPKGTTKKQRGRVGGDHTLRGGDGRYRTCWKTNLFRVQSQRGWFVRMIAQSKRAHVCEFCLIAQCVLATRGWKAPKGTGKGKHKGKQKVCLVCPGQGAKRPLDTGVESVMADSKNFESCVPANGDPREVPSGLGEGPTVSAGQVCGTVLEIVVQSSSWVQEACQRGLTVHPFVNIDEHVVEPFDGIKVALKRGEVDWLNVVPSTNWFALDRVLTRMLKLLQGSPPKRHLVEHTTRVRTLALQWCRVTVAIGRCRHVVTSGGTCTNAPFWDEPGIGTDSALVDEFIKALTVQCKDPHGGRDHNQFGRRHGVEVCP